VKTKPKPTRFKVNPSLLDANKWVLSPHISKIRAIENNDELVPLSSVAQVAQGMSPGVKSVFVMSKKETEMLELEQNVLVPFISNKNIKRWKLNIETKMFAILPSRIEQLSDYRNVEKYLQLHKKKLTIGSDRKRLLSKNKIRWFDFSVYRNLDLFEGSILKIFCPYRSLYPRFSLDKEGHFGATDTYAVVAKKEDDFYSLLGILNSCFVNFWSSEAGKRKGNMMEFFSDPLNNIPLPSIKERKKIVGISRTIFNELRQEAYKNSEKILDYENELNRKIAEMYDLDYEFLMKYSNKKIKLI
jgi:adenine-specific DNA-methyltransferase